MAAKSKPPAKPNSPSKSAVKPQDPATRGKSTKPVAEKPKAKTTPAANPKKSQDAITDSPSQKSTASVANKTTATATRQAAPRTSFGVVLVWLVIIGLVIGAGTSRQYWLPQVTALFDRITASDEMSGDESAQIEAVEQAVEDARAKQEIAAFAEQESARIKVNADMAVILNRLGGVEDSMRDLKQVAAAVSNSDVADDARAALDVLTQRLQVMEKRNQENEDIHNRDVAALVSITQRIEVLETASANNNPGTVSTAGDAIVRASSLVLAVGQLRTIVRQGSPYGGELSAVIATADNRESIQSSLDILAVSAETGVKQLRVLRTSFEGAIMNAVKAGAQTDQAGWIDDVLNKLSGLVVIRKIDGLAGLDTVDARISRAQSSLGEGDLATVIGVIEGLEQPAAQAFAEWLTDARSFMAIELALDELYSHVIAQLASMKE